MSFEKKGDSLRGCEPEGTGLKLQRKKQRLHNEGVCRRPGDNARGQSGPMPAIRASWGEVLIYLRVISPMHRQDSSMQGPRIYMLLHCLEKTAHILLMPGHEPPLVQICIDSLSSDFRSPAGVAHLSPGRQSLPEIGNTCSTQFCLNSTHFLFQIPLHRNLTPVSPVHVNSHRTLETIS